ncbi:MAG: hypothetical protein EPO62_05090 [Candidatus Nitrosotenuis sp.]|nr:MAG: hypothetical protein EPO62_05090 [Candidatus Nitrosotenuis sp.]
MTTRKTYVASAIAASVLIFALVGITNSFATSTASKGQSQVTPDQAANNVASFLSVDPKTVQVDSMETEHGQNNYRANVEKNGQLFEVKINAETGKIISVAEDQPDGNNNAEDGETNDDTTDSTDNGDGDGETNDDTSQTNN